MKKNRLGKQDFFLPPVFSVVALTYSLSYVLQILPICISLFVIKINFNLQYLQTFLFLSFVTELLLILLSTPNSLTNIFDLEYFSFLKGKENCHGDHK